MRSYVEEHPISRQHSRTPIIQEHLKRLRSHEATRPHDQLGAAGRVALPVHGDQPVDHVALALSHTGHVDHGGARQHPELFRMLHQRGDLRAPDLVLARETVDVRTGAADPSSLHDGGAVSRLRHVPGQILATLSTAEDQDFNPFGFEHHAFPLRPSPRHLCYFATAWASSQEQVR